MMNRVRQQFQSPGSSSKYRRIGIPVQIESYLKYKEENMKNKYEDQWRRNGDLQRHLSKNTDVRYLENLLTIGERIKSSYLCNSRECPKIRDRLEQHLRDHHQMALSPLSSVDYLSIQEPSLRFCEVHSVQTDPAEYCTSTSSDFNNSTELSSNKSIPLKSTETYKILSTNRIFYKQYLQDEILNWASDVPIDSNISNAAKVQREVVIYDLIDKINDFLEYIDSDDYEEKLKREIDACLNSLSVWTPETEHKKASLSNTLSEDLIQKIKGLNRKWCNFINGETIYKGRKYSYEIREDFNGENSMIYRNCNDNHNGEDNDELINFNREVNSNVPHSFKVEKTVIDDNEENTFDSVFKNNSRNNSFRGIFTIENRNKTILEITNWLHQVELKSHVSSGQINKKEIAETFLNRLEHSLNRRTYYANNKLELKGNIIDTINDLPVRISRNRIYLHRLAEDLTNRLISIRIEYEKLKENHSRQSGNQNIVSYSHNEEILKPNPQRVLKQKLFEEVTDRLGTTATSITRDRDLEKEIADILIECIKSVLSGNDQYVRTKVSTFLHNAGKLSELEVTNVSNFILNTFRGVIAQSTIERTSLQKPSLSGTVLVYQSDTPEPTQYPITSTPKKRKIETPKKSMPKLNPEEKDYIEKLAALVKPWMKTLPVQFNKSEAKEFKQTIVYDLAGDIMDLFKLTQMVPRIAKDKKDFLEYVIYRWLIRFQIYSLIEDFNSYKHVVRDLMNKVLNIPEPQLTRPQRGSRQVLANIKFANIDDYEGSRDHSFVPTGSIVLKDEISIWMNEQPSKIYLNNDKSFQQNKIHELAEKLHNRLSDKIPDKVITKEVEQWLNKLLKPEERKNVQKLSKKLKERLKKIPQDKTLLEIKEKRNEDFKELVSYHKAIERGEDPRCESQVLTECAPANNVRDLDKTLKEFIDKYLEHYYDSEDYTVRKAYGKILTTELRKLSPPTRKEVYDNFAKSETHAAFSPEALALELEFIKDISDWLKTVPTKENFSEQGNAERINFITDLARSIYEIEAERLKAPHAMDYDSILQSVITYSFKVLPVKFNYRDSDKTNFLARKLQDKITAHRPPDTCCGSTPAPPPPVIIKEEDIGDIIQGFIQNNAGDIADDPGKLEVWYRRLLEEVKRLVQETADPADLSKSHVYHRLNDVPRPEEDTMRRFNLKFEYMREAFLWLKNLPLQPVPKEEQIKLIQVLVNELAERIEIKKAINSSDSQADKEIVNYISDWIRKLPLEPGHNIVLPVAIHQLMNRLQRVQDDLPRADTNVHEAPDKSKSKAQPAGVKPKSIKQPCCGTLNPQVRLKVDNPEGYIVETIVKWCNGLPIKGNNEDEVKTLKDNMIKRLFERIWDLNMDPRCFHDDVMYKDMLVDELDAQLDNFPLSSSLKNNKEQLKEGLIIKMLEAKKLIVQKSAGDDYKQRLENAVEASMPNPIEVQPVDDPGFQIYKSHLASMFILENFDHTNEELKLKYEKRIKEEIDRYFEDAQRRNAVPLAKEQIYNELYASLFKVPVPNETSVVAEVEEVKTRCEIDAWFEELPLQKMYDKNDLLQWDQILSTLAKRLHEIEKKETNPDEKMHKVITKWLVKFPLLPGQEEHVDQFSEKLRVRLKATTEARRCVLAKESSFRDEQGVSHQFFKSTDRQCVKDVARSKSGADCTPEQIQTAQEHDPCCQLSSVPQKRSGDIIQEIVGVWCSNLPFIVNTVEDEQNVKLVKDNLATKIIVKISELNVNPEIFQYDDIYDKMFDDALDSLLVNLPGCCELQQSKAARKKQLIESIKTVKPIIRAERERQEYKEQLRTTVTNVLEKSEEASSRKLTEFKNIVDDIVDSFMEKRYTRDDEGRLMYRKKVQDVVLNFFLKIREDQDTSRAKTDALMRTNQLEVEMEKIPIPSESVIREEVQEIRMKEQVSRFFEELSFPEEDEEKMEHRRQIKSCLAKMLNDIEKSGHNCDSHQHMKREVTKCLKKLDKEISPEIIDAFISKLQQNEKERKASPLGHAANCTHASIAKQQSKLGQGAGIAAPGTSSARKRRQSAQPVAASASCSPPRREARSPYRQPTVQSPMAAPDSAPSAGKIRSNKPITKSGKSWLRRTWASETPIVPASSSQSQQLLREQESAADQQRKADKKETDNSDDCGCTTRKKTTRHSGRPYCFIRLLPCNGFGPFLCGMWYPYHGCFYC